MFSLLLVTKFDSEWNLRGIHCRWCMWWTNCGRSSYLSAV